MNFIHSFQSEWLKKKGSLASYLVFIGAFFTPLIVTIIRTVRYEGLAVATKAPDFWEKQWSSSWESMAIFLLPMGIIMAAALIAQLEFKNNAWKQLHTTPQSLTIIFLAKHAVILTMMVQLFVLFNLGVYLSGIIPNFLRGIPYPSEPIPFVFLLKEDVKYFLVCLPIVALQYLISLRFSNFLVPVGAGLVIWFGTLASLSWKYSYIFPFSHSMLSYLKTVGKYKQDINFEPLAAGYFVVITMVSYVIYVKQRERG